MGSKSRSWTKLYRHPSSEWRALPLWTRALGAELLRHSDDEGKLYVGRVPAQFVTVLARLLRIHAGERRAFVKHLDALIAHGYCGYVSVAGEPHTYLVLRNDGV